MCGGGSSAPPQPVYTANDGTSFADPNAAQNHNRSLQLAATMGYAAPAPTSGSPTAPADAFSAWQAANPTFTTYDSQGLTGADYTNQQAIITQQQQAAAAQAQQTANIAASRSAIDTAFGGYDDAYFKNVGDTVQQYYQPQLNSQFADAQKNLTYKFANQGNTASTAYTDAQAKLNSLNDLQTSNVASQAADAETAARENVGATKQKLYTEADTGADPAAVNTDLNNSDSQLKAYAPTLTPMGKVFSDYMTPVVNGVGSAVAGYQQGANTSLFNSALNGTSGQTYGQS